MICPDCNIKMLEGQQSWLCEKYPIKTPFSDMPFKTNTIVASSLIPESKSAFFKQCADTYPSFLREPQLDLIEDLWDRR